MDKVCRVCSKLGNQYEIIGKILKDLLDTLLIPLDMTVLKEPIICKECMKQLYELFDFKTICLYTEDALFPFMKNYSKKTPLNLRSVYFKSKSLQSSEIGQKTEICRLCLEITTQPVVLSETVISQTSILDVLKNYLPEISLQATVCPCICQNCSKMLHSLNEFTLLCTRSDKNKENRTKEFEESTRENDEAKYENSVDNQFEGSGVEEEREPTLLNMDAALEFLAKICEYHPQSENTHCYKCPYETKDKSALETHLKTHLPKIQKGVRVEFYKCFIENCVFLSRFDRHIIRAHAKTHAKHKACPICGAVLQGAWLCSRHIELKHREGDSYKCVKCPFRTEIRNKLERHAAKHSDVLLSCDRCTFKAKYRPDLLRHRASNHKGQQQQTYSCHDCSYSTRNKQCLRIHVLVHASDTRSVLHACDRCDFATKYKGCLQKHRKRMHDENRELFPCCFCGGEFKSSWERRMHIIQLHGPDDEVRRLYVKKCPECDYETHRVAHMRVHLKKVHGSVRKRESIQCNRPRLSNSYLKMNCPSEHKNMSDM